MRKPMSNHETTATITHIHFSEKTPPSTCDSIYDVFGNKAGKIYELSDRIYAIDHAAASFLIQRACIESKNATMSFDEILDALENSFSQLEELAQAGYLTVSAA